MGIVSLKQISKLEDLGFIWNLYEHNWKFGIAQLKIFFAQRGHAGVPVNFTTAKGFKLGSWVEHKRRPLILSKLSKEKIAELDALDFVWNPEEAAFELGIKHLSAFIEKEGHSRVPQNFKTSDGFNLGSWVGVKRRSKKRGTLPSYQKHKLNLLNFFWEVFDEQWIIGLAHLQNFLGVKGHALVPKNFKTPDGFNLGQWTAIQRRSNKKGSLSTKQIIELEKLGFIWEVKAYHWSQAHNYLQQFIKEEGHSNVPDKFITKDGFNLGYWVANIRKSKNRGTLKNELIMSLEKMGFNWRPSEDIWVLGLVHLKQFIGEHGHAKVPQAFVTESGFKLGLWVSNRRSEKKRNKLSKERIEELDCLGFIWDVRKTPSASKND